MDYEDATQIREYQQLATPTLSEFGIQPLGKSLDAEPLEGTAPGRLTVLLKAGSVADAERWFQSPGYQRAAEARRPVSRFFATIVPG